MAEGSQEAKLSDKMELMSTGVHSANPHGVQPGEIVTLNVGGRRFATSRQTLTWIPDSFFTSLMSGRIPSLKDEAGAIFIDRDPEVFVPILNFMRTRSVDMRNVELKTLKHEAEFYGILPLVKRLNVCVELERSNCGSLLFYNLIKPPVFEPAVPSGIGMESLPHPHLLKSGTTLLRESHQGFVTRLPDFSRQVLQIVGHGSYIAVAYNHCICVLGVRESRGWDVFFTTPPLERVPQRIALHTRMVGGAGPIVAAVLGNEIKIWSCSPSSQIVASFDMKIPIDGLFFIGMQLVAISSTGKVAVWQSVQKHWQLQDVEPICSYNMAGSFLLLGCTNGSIYYIDMEKFPVRMKDNDLLVTQLFEDPCKEPITALSVYVTPNVFPGSSQNWMEVAYGTEGGTVRVVVRHPENIGQAPQIFQSYNVHTCPILRVVLGEKHLISVCAENHVRTWSVTRFRGRISTQPGSNPLSSFKVLSLEGAHSLFYPINSIGPFGDRDEEQVFIQRVIPETSIIFVRSCSTGNRVCKIESVDSSNISAYCVHECEAVNRIGMRSRRFIFTGHTNGTIQVWDLTTALELSHKNPDSSTAGPTKNELLELLQNCDVSAPSRMSSAVSSRAPSPSPSLMSIMYPGLKPISGRVSIPGTPLSTPLLARPINGGNGRSNVGGALFQPIRSVSNSSISSNTVPGPGLQAQSDGSSTTTATVEVHIESEQNAPQVVVEHVDDIGEESFVPETKAKSDLESEMPPTRSETGSMNTTCTEMDCGDDNEVVCSGSSIPCLKSGLEELNTTHQRSRSNEIDYSSLGYGSYRSKSSSSTSSAFRSPPGTVRGFRPPSVDSANSSLFGSITDSLLTSRSVSQRTSQISSSSESTITGGSGETTPTSTPTSSSKTLLSAGEDQTPLEWLKDMDPALISEYFGTSDKTQLKVTKC